MKMEVRGPLCEWFSPSDFSGIKFRQSSLPGHYAYPVSYPVGACNSFLLKLCIFEEIVWQRERKHCSHLFVAVGRIFGPSVPRYKSRYTCTHL